MDNLSCVSPVSVTEADGTIDYRPSERYPITLSEARRRALRSIKISREIVDSDLETLSSTCQLDKEHP